MRDYSQIERAFAEKGIAFERGVLLSRLTSYGIGGPAELFVMPNSPENTAFALKTLSDNRIQVFAIGKGTNILASDSGFDGALISIDNREIRQESAGIWKIGALASVDSVVEATALSGWSDAVGLAGIPGSFGGAVAMNAGAWGKETGALVESVLAFELCGEEALIDVHSAFQYRRFARRGEVLIFSTKICLETPSDPAACSKEIAEIREKRSNAQPLKMRSAGCVFKNPEGDHAGRLIDEAGLKGFAVGGASVSDIHANFIVTSGGASSNDVLRLVDIIRERVSTQFEIELELEIIKLGFGER